MDTKNKKIQVVDPSGHIVYLVPGQPVKEGWRLATAEDIALAERLEAERAKDEAATAKGGPLK